MSDFYDDAAELPEEGFGPVFTAMYASEDACCGDWIEVGERIRADDRGGWIHADTQCEKLAQGKPDLGRRGTLCTTCWLVHGQGQKGCA